MKLYFFGRKAPQCPDYLAIYILSLLDPLTSKQAMLVNKEWAQYVRLTQKYVALMPTLQTIPYLSNVTLDVLRIKLLAGGMTNTSYRLKLRNDSSKWVLRIPGQGSSAFIRREDEAKNALQASDLGLNVPIKYFGQDGLQLTRFIEGVQPLDKNALARKEILQKIATMMKQLHSSKTFVNDVHYFERNETLLKTLKSKSFVFPKEVDFIDDQMVALKKLFGRYQIPLKPCHNDTTPLNFILSHQDHQEMIHEIDWEYSGNNDYLWDLVYFIIEAKLDQYQEADLLESYFGEHYKSTSLEAWVSAYKPIIEWWITLWSWTQLVNEANAVELKSYEQLAQERYSNTLSYLTSEVYRGAVKNISQEPLEQSFSGLRSFTV